MNAGNICLVLFAALLSSVHQGESFKSTFDEPFLFVCQNDQSVVWTRSIHSNSKEDREFEFRCAPGPISTRCQWSAHVNDWDQPMHYVCPNNGAITGFYSFHSNKKEDRKWKIRCCPLIGAKRVNCRKTRYLNQYDQQAQYNVPYGDIMAGVYSIHNNRAEDRRWAFEVCKIAGQ